MQEEQMTGDQSLQVIHSMISQAKQQFSDESFNYLLWGWLVFIASLGQYALIMANVEQNYLVWLLMPVGAVISVIYNLRKNRRETVKTYVDEFMKYLVIAFMACLFIVLGFQGRLQLNTYPLLMMVYGMMLFVSGGSLRFTPLIIGGLINWVLAIIAFFFEFDMQLLLLAAAVLCGYIIPGHLLSNHYKKQH